MTTPLATANVYEFRLIMQHVGYNQEFVLTRWYKLINSLPGPAETLENALTTLSVAALVALAPGMSTQQFVLRYELRDVTGRQLRDPMDPNKGFKLIYAHLVATTGSLATDHGAYVSADDLPPTDSVSMEFRSTAAGRKAFGCVRFGVIPEAQQADGVLTAPAKVIWDAVATALVIPVTVGVGAGDMMPVIFNRTAYLNAPTIGLGDPSAFTQQNLAVDVAPTLGTQITRKRPIRRPGF